MATAWDEINGRAVANIAANRDGSGISGYRPNLLPEATRSEKLTKGQEAVWTQWAIRWPCPKDTDPNFYEARMSLLFRDISGLAAPMLVKAGDLIALKPGRWNVLPSASEVVEAVEAIMADRAAKQAATHRETTGIETPIVTPDGEVISASDYRPGADTGDNAERCRAINLRLIADNARYRVVPLGSDSAYRVQVVDDGTIVPNHVCDGKGGVYHHLGGKRPAMAMTGEDV